MKNSLRLLGLSLSLLFGCSHSAPPPCSTPPQADCGAELAAAKARIAELRERLSALEQKNASRTPKPRPSKPVVPDSATFTARAQRSVQNGQARAAARRKALEDQLRTEERNEAWAATFEARTDQMLKASELRGTEIKSKSCRGRTCKLEIVHSDPAAQQRFFEALEAKDVDARATLLRIQNTHTGESKTLYYLVR